MKTRAVPTRAAAGDDNGGGLAIIYIYIYIISMHLYKNLRVHFSTTRHK